MKIKIFGVVLEIKYSFLVLIIISFLSSIFRNYMYYYFACYLFIIFHELSHIFVASIFKCKLKKVEISICGMSANIELTKSKLKNIIIFLAGPLSNAILFIIFINNQFISKINIILAIINLIPIFPLDGYRIFREIGIKTNIFEYLIYFILLIIGLSLKNISIIIFIIYVILLKINNRRVDSFHC